MEEADQLSDRIGIIDQGKIIALDTPTALALDRDLCYFADSGNARIRVLNLSAAAVVVVVAPPPSSPSPGLPPGAPCTSATSHLGVVECRRKQFGGHVEKGAGSHG